MRISEDVKDGIIFKDLNFGDVFKPLNDSQYYMKCEDGINGAGTPFNSVNLTNGWFKYFMKYTEIMPVDCTLTINKEKES